MAVDLPSTMRAAQWTTTAGGIDKNMKLNTSVPLPKNAKSLPNDSTLVKIAYSTLNPVDCKIPETPIVSSLIFSKPATPCLDYAGTVVATTLPHLKPGELVFGKTDAPGFGVLGEYAVAPKQGCVPLPNGPETAFGLTAYQCIAPYVKAGGKVFINGGSGGTGTFGIQIAKAIGCSVTTTCSGPNVELCRSLGADEVIDYRTTDVVSHLKRSGTQYDLLIDNVNTPAIYWDAQHYLKPEGKYITIAGDASLSNIYSMAMMFLLPSWFGGGKRSPKFVACVSNAEQYAQLAKWMAERKLKTVVEETYELEDVGKAFARMKSGRTRGKLVVSVGGE